MDLQHARYITLESMFNFIKSRDDSNGNSYDIRVMKMAGEGGSVQCNPLDAGSVGGGGVSPSTVTRHDSADSIFGDLDCNDNTPVLLPKIDTSTSQPSLHDNVMSPSKSCVSTSSSVSHPSLSPDDAANNDFFYDDEFSVPFDATLAEQEEVEDDGETEVDMLDSVDISSLLSLQQLYPNNNGPHRRRGITLSRSDTCLYQFDLDLSASERSNSVSCEQSFSEHNYASSSELSDLKSEPLFTPPPSQSLGQSAIELSTDSLGAKIDDTDDEALSNSFMTDEGKYSYDWSAHKDKYMLSFDKSPTKYSDEEMDCHSDSTVNERSSTTIPQHESITKMRQPRNELAMSESQSRKNDLKKTTFSNIKRTEGLMTWGQVKQVKDQGRTNSLTTWGAVAKHHSSDVDEVTNNESDQETSILITDSLNKTSFKSDHQRLSQSKNSTSLYEIFQSVRSHTNDEYVDQTMSCTSSSPPHLTTWGAASKKPVRSLSDASRSETQLISFASLQNNNNNIDGNTSEEACVTETLHHFTGASFENGGAASWQKTVDPNTSGFINPNSSQTSYRHSNSEGNLIDLNVNEQTAKSVSHEKDCRKSTNHVVANDLVTLVNKGQAIFTIKEDCGKPIAMHDSSNITGSLQSFNVKTEVPQFSSKTIENYTKENDLQGSQRLSRSVFFTSTTLPDLSFLSKNMAQSVTEASQTISQTLRGHAKPALVTPKLQTREHNATLKTIIKSTPLKEIEERDSENETSDKVVNKISSAVPIPKSGSRPHRTSDSSVNTSINSSSSSGIDPGSYESPKNKLSFVPGHRLQNNEGSSDGGSSETSGEGTCTSKLSSNSEQGSSFTGTNIVKCDNMKTRSERTRRFKQRSSSCPERSDSNQCKVHKTGVSPLYDLMNDQENSSVDSLTCAICHLNMSQSLPKAKTNGATKPQCQHRECTNLSPSHGHGFVCIMNRVSAPIQSNTRQICTCSHDAKITRCSSLDRNRTSHGKHEKSEKIPLKSCLAKKKPETLKCNSLSEDPDLAIMRYSEEGQTRYQLVTYECPCRSSCDTSYHQDVAVTTVCRRSLGDQVNDKLGQISLQPICLHNKTSSWQPCVFTRGCKAPPNSPENYLGDLHCCCHQQHRLCRSESSQEEESDSDNGRTKKSVKFSENISYHSPHSSPHQSPRKQPIPSHHSVTSNSVKRHSTLQIRDNHNLCTQGMCTHSDSFKPISVHDSLESPPRDFNVSPTSKSPPIIFTENGSVVDVAQKKDLVKEVILASEAIINHFSQTTDPYEKVRLGSSGQCGHIAHLVLTGLCPAMYAVLCDGLHQHTRSLFGRVKNSVWKVVQESSELGPSTRVVYEVFREVKGQAYLSTTWMKFNAFLLGMLNHRTLDFWMTYVHSSNKLMLRHYHADSLMRLSNGPLDRLFADMITALQPLAELPFRLEYNAEYCMMMKREISDDGIGSVGKQLQINQSKADNVSLRVTGNQSEAGIVNDLISCTPNESVDSIVSSCTLTMSDGSQSSAEVNAILTDSQDHMISKRSSPSDGNIKMAGGQTSPMARNESVSPFRSQDLQVMRHTATEWTNWALGTLSSYAAAAPPLTDLTKALGPVTQKPMVKKPLKYLKTLVRNVAESTESVIPINSLNQQLAPSSHPRGNQGNIQSNLSELHHAAENNMDCVNGPMTKARDSKGTSTPRQAVLVVKDNAILSPEYYGNDSDSSDKQESGMLHKITKQWLDPTVPDHKVYKKGITEYEFDMQMELPSGGKQKRQSVSRGCSTKAQTDGGTVGREVTSAPNTPNEPPAPPAKQSRWSIGPSIINFFDKLLLVDKLENQSTSSVPNAERTERVAPPGGDSENHQRSVSSGVASPDGLRSMSVDSVSEPLTIAEQTPTVRLVRALCHYVASDVDQLSFKKGDIMTVIEDINFDWLLCSHSGTQGLVHIACVENKAA